ncbi:MAG: hypothetical protein ACOX6Q_01945 [Candidatus Dojkabacteria bacterium]|jgi:hypothetical protein
MDILKKSFFALVLLFVVVLMWIGFSVYFESTKSNVDSRAVGYTKVLKTKFDMDILDEVMNRSEESFPVTADEFLSLVEED